MEISTKIASILRNIVSCRGITDIFFAGDKVPPPLLAFAVHFPRLTAVIDGIYKTQLEQNGRITTIQLLPNQMLFVPANCWDKPDMNCKSQALHFLFGKRHTGISLVTTEYEVVAEKIALESTLAGPEQKIVDAILELNQLKQPYYAFTHLSTALLSCFINPLEDFQKSSSSNSYLLFQDICVYIQENFQREISRSSVAQQYGISPNHLSRLFKQNGYMKFCDYVNYTRINRAKFLLQNYELPLYQIAKQCGYNDSVYFCRIFKRITKKTAMQYRNQLLHNNKKT